MSPLPEGIDPRVLGGVPKLLVKLGIIRRSGSTKSDRPNRNASVLAVWELANRDAALAWLTDNSDLPDTQPDNDASVLSPAPSPSLPSHYPGCSETRTPIGNPGWRRMTHEGTLMPECKRLADILVNSDRDRLERAWTLTTPAADLMKIPARDYRCLILSGELFNAKNGTPGYKLALEVLEGDYAGRRIWHDLWLTEAAMPMAKRDLAKLGINSLEQMERHFHEGIIINARVSLRRDDGGTESNRVVRFDVVAVEPPEPDPFAPVPSANGEEDPDHLKL